MYYKTIFAVDPGASGAIVICFPNGEVKAHKMPETAGGVRDLLKDSMFVGSDSPQRALAVLYLEDVVGNAAGCRTAQQGFSFGLGIGHLEMACLCLGIPRIDIKPQAWQKALSLGGIGTKRCTKEMTPEERKSTEESNARLRKEWKNKLKAEAEQRFPTIRVTLNNADALLILGYAIEKEVGAPLNS